MLQQEQRESSPRADKEASSPWTAGMEAKAWAFDGAGAPGTQRDISFLAGTAKVQCLGSLRAVNSRNVSQVNPIISINGQTATGVKSSWISLLCSSPVPTQPLALQVLGQ